jgi:phosphoglycerol geranylgeranyltransferase
MTQRIYESLIEAKQNGEKRFAVLIDPDKMRLGNMEKVLSLAIEARVDYFLVGGSLVVNDMMDYCLDAIREASVNIPTILFPGSPQQINHKANAILFLSLISGRNADLLIGQHVLSAPTLKRSPLEVISTGYMLIDGGAPTTASYVSGTHPIPANKDEIAYCTALAGELLGLKTIYMDAGSGAKNPISESMISMVSRAIDIPLIVGGGMRTPEKAAANARAGADVIVVGNAIEKDPSLILDIAQAVRASVSTFKV